MEQNSDTVKKIFIVEDNPDSRELVVKILKAKGYGIIEAVDGEEALMKLKEQRPDLILMDISIPKIDGYEVTRRIKRDDCLKDVPVIALTAHAMKGDREKALEAGCDGYIAKPFSVRELPRLIESFLKRGLP